MGEIINQYELIEPFHNKNAGFSRWTFAKKEGKNYFIKEFLDPVYPMDNTLTEKNREKRIRDCEEFEEKQKNLYETINNASDGNLVRISEFFRYDSHYYITTERIVEQKIPMAAMVTRPMEDRIFLCKSIAHTIYQLHNINIVHADIKENNVLLKQTSTNKLVGKIIDFGCSFFENDPPQYEDELGGDQVYLSPEACLFICGDPVELTCKLDVFSLGLLFHQYLTGELPGFDTDEYDYAFEAVLDEKELVVSSKLPEKLQMMIKGMLEADPEKRYSMKQVYELFDEKERLSKAEKELEVKLEDELKRVTGNWFYKAGDL